MADAHLSLKSILAPLHAHDDGHAWFSHGLSVSFRTNVSASGRHIHFPEGHGSPEMARLLAEWMDRHAPSVGRPDEHEPMRAIAEACAKAMNPVAGEDPAHG